MAAPQSMRRACSTGDALMVRQLLASGESPNALSDEKTGETLLFVAAQNGHEVVCAELLSAGAFAYVNKGRFVDAATPLHMAAGKGHAPVVRALLEGRAVPDRADSRAGRTPLFHAASRGQLEAVRLLLHAGANPNWLDQQGVVPLYVAAQNGEAAVVEELLRAGAIVNGVAPAPPPGARRPAAPAFIPLHAAAKHGHLETARQLLRAAADPMLTTANGQTALNISVQNGRPAVAELLLRECRGAVDCAAADGTTPLLAASTAGHAPCCELLLLYGANPDIPDVRGVPPVMAAIKKARAGHVAVVTALLDAGCAEPPRSVQEAVEDRPMAGLLILAETRRLVGAMQRLAWATLLLSRDDEALQSGRRRSIGLTPRGRRSRPSGAATSAAALHLPVALLYRCCTGYGSRPLALLIVAGRAAEERARTAISLAAASQSPTVVAATLARYRGDATPPSVQRVLAAELAQLEASLGQLQHQEFRANNKVRIACCGSRPARGAEASRSAGHAASGAARPGLHLPEGVTGA